MSYLQAILPSEVVGQIQAEQHHPQWVRLEPAHDQGYYLVSTTEPSPLMRVCTRTREVMIYFNFTLRLRAKSPDKDHPDLFMSFNYEKDTLYLDLDIQSICKGMSLTSLLAAIPEHQIKQIQNLAVAFYPSRNPDNLLNSAPQFTTDLDYFSALQSLKIVPWENLGTDPVAHVLAEWVPELQSTQYSYMNDEEDIGGAGEPRLQGWLNIIRAYTDRRNITVDVAPT